MLPKLEVLIPDPAKAGFRLDYSALDTHTLNDAPDIELELGTSRLDTGRLAPYLPPPTWHDLIDDATEISTWEGYRANDIVLVPDVGSLSADLKNAPDLGSIGVGFGTPIRVIIPTAPDKPSTANVPGYSNMWLGRITNISETWKRGHARSQDTLYTTIEAEDAVSAVAAIQRYGARTAQSLDERLASLAETLRSAIPDASIAPTGDATRIAATVHESNLLDYLTMTAATACRALEIGYANHGEGLQVEIRLPPDPRRAAYSLATYSDSEAPSYFMATRETGTADIISAIEITNHLMATDGSALEETKTISDPTLVSTFGTRTERLEITAPRDAVEQIGRWALTPSVLAKTSITGIDIRGRDAFPTPHVLTPGSPITVKRLGATYPLVVSSVAHTIRVDTRDPFYTHSTKIETRRRFPNGG
ncbi:MAG: hypothetical protein E7L00_08480 [Propionibacteriaceae bacterium]|nr:hypothetical protein [Propionibacteriaceae bacterium]